MVGGCFIMIRTCVHFNTFDGFQKTFLVKINKNPSLLFSQLYLLVTHLP